MASPRVRAPICPARAWRVYVYALPAPGPASREWRGRALRPIIRSYHDATRWSGSSLGRGWGSVASGGRRAGAGVMLSARKRPPDAHVEAGGGADLIRDASARPPRPAFYAQPRHSAIMLTLLHPPYTLWHLSYFAIGAALAPVHLDRLLWGLAAPRSPWGSCARARRAARPAAARGVSDRGWRAAQRR